MSKPFLFLLSVLYSLAATGHPGIGVVKDSKGFIYYTDLTQIWKIDPVSQKKTVVVPNVHTHELYMDAGDNLYGEHLWYNGEQLNTWGHYVWRLQRDGVLDTVVNPAEGFLEDYSFVRDSMGNMYTSQRFLSKSRILKIAPGGQVVTLTEKKFNNIRWMHATPAGVLYFVDLTDLYKIENDQLKLVASHLTENTSLPDHVSSQHDVYGTWLDNAGNVYVALLNGQVVKKITPDGKIKAAVYSSGTWLPCAGVFDDQGNMWLMEANTANEVRVRKITPAKLANPPASINKIDKTGYFALMAGTILLMGLVLYIVLKKLRKKNKAVDITR